MSLLVSNPSYSSWLTAINTNYNISTLCEGFPKSSSSLVVKRSCLKNLIKPATDHKPYYHPLFETYVVEKSHSVNRILSDTVVVSDHAKSLGKSIEYSLLLAPGPLARRVRGALCIAACELVGSEECTAVPTACAIEMIHSGSTILADLPSVCRNDLRWGKATNHEVFGEDMTILAGHALMSDAILQLVTRSKLVLPPQRIFRLISVLAKYIGSQGLASDYHAINKFNVHFHKPEAIFELSLVLGAIAGGAAEDDDSDPRIDRLKDFARCIGPLFHIVELASLDHDDDDYVKSFIRQSMLNNTSSVEMLCTDAKNHLMGAAFDANKVAPLIALADTIIANSHNM